MVLDPVEEQVGSPVTALSLQNQGGVVFRILVFLVDELVDFQVVVVQFAAVRVAKDIR